MKWIYCITSFLILCNDSHAAITTPGVHHVSGRVVKRANGQLDVFNGLYCASLPTGKTSALSPFLEKFVTIEFTTIASEMSYTGTAFGEITHVTEIEESTENTPIEVKIEPTKKVFVTTEPITVKVTLENRSKALHTIALTSSHTIVSQDYEKVFWMEPDDQGYPEKSYKFVGRPDYGKLAPGELIEFTVESRNMAEPGDYKVSYALSLGVNNNCTSELVSIRVVRPENGSRSADLKLWLKKSALGQRINIAEKLAKAGDREAIDEFLEQLESGIYLGNGFFYQDAYRLAFQYGGEKGEKLMLKIIQGDKFQESATTLISFVSLAKNKKRLFSDLLSCEHAIEISLGGWADGTRICDITADYLMHRAEQEMRFPKNGSVFDRNKSVESVQLILKENPEAFSVLKSTPSI